MSVVTAVDVLPRRMAGWAARRSLAPNALTGIWLACCLCAAAWFTAGTRSDAAGGGLALAVGYLAYRVRAQLVEFRGPAPGGAVGVAAPPMLAAFEEWLASVWAAAGEFAVYAGLALGARAGQRHGIWVLATDAAITLSIRQVAGLLQPVTPSARPPGSSLSLVAGWLLTLPTGARIAVIAVTAPLWGARITFLTLIVWGAVAVAWALARPRWTSREPAVSGQGVIGRAEDWIAACRDDGPLARLAGRIVQGQLVPLPPALAALIGTVMLAALGLGNLTGILALAPVAAMLLAAAGAGHRHDGRLDWLVPLVMQATQYIYLAALGFAMGAPGPVTFVMISMVALRQLDVTCRARQPAGWPPQRATRLGWEGRILVVGLAALLAFVTFAYVGLTAYLGWLLCRVSLSGWHAVRESGINEPPINAPTISEGERR